MAPAGSATNHKTVLEQILLAGCVVCGCVVCGGGLWPGLCGWSYSCGRPGEREAVARQVAGWQPRQRAGVQTGGAPPPVQEGG